MTLVLVQMTYSISSEYGFWKVKLLVRISSHSRLLVRNRYMTDSTWPFSLTTCRHTGTGPSAGARTGAAERGWEGRESEGGPAVGRPAETEPRRRALLPPLPGELAGACGVSGPS